jgi:hypothetical protein
VLLFSGLSDPSLNKDSAAGKQENKALARRI